MSYLSRRDFIKTAGIVGGAGIGSTVSAYSSPASSDLFGIHPFIENNPDAVFIMRTNVDEKTNGTAIRDTARAFGNTVFVHREDGVPLTSLVPIKPNITNVGFTQTPKDLPTEEAVKYRMGIITDPWFIEGIAESIKDLGVSAGNIWAIDTWHLGNWGPMGFDAMTERSGINMNDTFDSQYRAIKVANLPEEKVQWIDVPDGVWFRKIPYIWPWNSENTWQLNVAKFKTHGMGVTLCCKNLQGTICQSYQEHCSRYGSSMNVDSSHLNPTANADIQANYDRHLAAGVPRWDKPGSNGGIWQETWGSRCLDNQSVTNCELHIVEGIYGRDGNGFNDGPNTGEYNDHEAWDYMTNIIIFGRNQYNVDIVGHWLAGHEPGNFGLFHMAIDRGYTTELNPMNIPVYEWFADGTAELTPLTNFERTPLKTYFLQRDYDGQNEPYYHLCDEPFEYQTPTLVNEIERPEAFILGQNSPNPFNPTTAIQYNIPEAGTVRLEVFNSNGQLVDVLANGWKPAGSHLANWQAHGLGAGVYFYRLRFGGYSDTRKMTLLK